MNQDQMKQQAAIAAMQFIEDDMIIGVGTGSTVNFFIDQLATQKNRIDAAVASSEATAERLKAHGIAVIDLNVADHIPLYVDGADEFTTHKMLIKGGGGALTREKIIAAVADKFICIADEKKQVGHLGEFPVPVEVIPMARSYVARQIVKLGGDPIYREGVVTDNGNIILDVHQLDLSQAMHVEEALNNITGVVCNGIFARRGADLVLVAQSNGDISQIN